MCAKKVWVHEVGVVPGGKKGGGAGKNPQTSTGDERGGGMGIDGQPTETYRSGSESPRRR